MRSFSKLAIIFLIITLGNSFSNAQMNTRESFSYFEVDHPFQDSIRPAPIIDKDGFLWKLTSHSLLKIKGGDTILFNFPKPAPYNWTWDFSAWGNQITFLYKTYEIQEEKYSRWFYYLGYYNGEELKFFQDTTLSWRLKGNPTIVGVTQTSNDIWLNLGRSTLRFDKQNEVVVNDYDIYSLHTIDTNELIGLIGSDYYLWDIQKDTMTKILPDDDVYIDTEYSDSTKTLYSVGRKRVYIYRNKELKSYNQSDFNTGLFHFYEFSKDVVIFNSSNSLVLIDKDKIIQKQYYPDFTEYSGGNGNISFGFYGPTGLKSSFLDNGMLILSFLGMDESKASDYFYYNSNYCYYLYLSYFNGELNIESFKPYQQSAFFYKSLTGDKYFYHTNYDFYNESIIPNILTIEKNNEPPVSLLLPEQIPYSMRVAADSNYVWILNDTTTESPYRIWRIQPNVVYVKGNVFYDTNHNGVRDSNEVGVSKYPLIVKPGNIKVFPDVNGNFGFGSQINQNYKLEIPADSLFDYESSPLPFPLTVSDTNNIGLTLKDPGLDVTPNFSLPRSRCNETETAHLRLQNTGFGTIDKLNLTVISDPLASIHSNKAIEKRGDTLIFEVANLEPSMEKYIDYDITFPGGEHLGEMLKVKIVADIYLYGSLYKSISDSLETELRCSFDPNDKAVTPAGVGQDNFTLKDLPLSYLIRFENTGNDTAYTVTVYDTLDAALDPSTITILGSSHSVITNVMPRGKIVFHFENIMLPDSTTNKEKAQGFVRFSINPVKDLAEGQVIRNKAGIVFDQNTPVITNEVYNTLVTKLPGDYVSIKDKKNNISLVYPNPANTVVHLKGVGGAYVEVYDFTGKKIFNSQSCSIDVRDWQDGLYIFRVLNTDGNVLKTEKVLIAK